eukprot:UN32723
MGRCVLGLFTESLDSALLTCVFSWVRPDEGARAMSIAGSGGALGIALSFLISELLYSYMGLTLYLWSSSWCMGIAIVTALFIWNLEKEFAETEVGENVVNEINQEEEEMEEPTWWDVFQCLDIRFWLIVLLASFAYAITENFNGNLTGYIQGEGYTFEYANNILTVGYFSFIVISPILACFVDRFQRLPTFLLISNTIKAGAVIMLVHHTSFDPFLSTVIFMFGFSMFNSAIWPAAQKCIPSEKMMGRAFGILGSLQNLIIGLSMVGGGLLQPPTESWRTLCFTYSYWPLFAWFYRS